MGMPDETLHIAYSYKLKDMPNPMVTLGPPRTVKAAYATLCMHYFPDRIEWVRPNHVQDAKYGVEDIR